MGHVEACRDAEPVELGRAHWIVFLPTIAIAFFFTLAWGLLEAIDKGHTLPARAAFLVSVLATPLLALLSFLRFQTTRIVQLDDGLSVETGWPSVTPKEMALADIAGVKVEPAWFSSSVRAGTLVLELKGGEILRLREIADPIGVATALRGAIATHQERP